ncbi:MULTISPECIES: hypothetical protein [Flavobacterium]|uniref:Uncharacterized protein n=1 Tax=Flavobacterium jumunjinense TaxID=998845 RepID=A0ABV5GRP1_9FLAO|nr:MULTISPECIES: hypothetical protein [Flavobacterium]
MKKIIVLLLVTQVLFAQKLTKEELIDKISENTCNCTTEKGITQENMDITLGVCILESITKYEKDVEKHFGKNIIADEEKMGELAEGVGAKMAFTCPAFLEIIMKMGEGEFEEEELLYIDGKITATQLEQFLTFTVKEESGKSHTVLLLEEFENSYLITDSVIKPKDKVKVSYYEADLYDAKTKKFVTFKVVQDIIKE